MGETIFGEILEDLKREAASVGADEDGDGSSRWGDKANKFEGEMRKRAEGWNRQSVPFGSEMAWDSTGQEGVWYWSRSVLLCSVGTSNWNDRAYNVGFHFLDISASTLRPQRHSILSWDMTQRCRTGVGMAMHEDTGITCEKTVVL